MSRKIFWGLCFLVASSLAYSDTFHIPSGPLPPGCSLVTGSVQCPTNLNFGNNDVIIVTSPTELIIGGDLSFGNGFKVNISGLTSDLSIVVNNNLNPGNYATINANLTVLGSVNSANNAEISGSISITGNLNLGNNSVINGNITVDGTINTGENVTVNGQLKGTNINLGQNNKINGDIETVNLNINGGNTVVDGNINATGSVNVQGTVTGYINAKVINDNGATIEGPTCDLNENVGGCNGGGPGPQVLYYQIELPGSALTCQSTPISVTACASVGCATTANINGSITLSAAGPVNVFASASFTNSSSANLLFDLSSAGLYTFSVSNADTPAINPYQCIGSCQLLAQDTVLVFSPTATQTAGIPFQSTASVVTVDQQSGVCITSVEQITQLDIAVECVDPGSCASSGALFYVNSTALSQWPATSVVSASFNNQGETTLNMNYLDAGLVRVRARAQTAQGAQILGASDTFVVRPAGILFDITTTSSYTGSVFAKAGESMIVILAAVTAQEVITPNFGLEQNPEVLTLSPQAQTTIPANGVDGAVNIASQFAKVGPGTFASTDIRYNEVGTAIFRAFVESQDYLGSGPLESNSEPIGRFIPWKFEIRNSSVAAGCQDTDEPFTYLSQPITFDAAVVAINRDLQRTMNYPDTGSGVSVGISAADTVQQQDLSSRIETRWHQPDWQHGKGYLTSRQFSVNRLTGFQPEGPFESVAFALFIDGMNTDEGLHSPAHDADFSETDWDCQNNDNCYAVLLDEPSQFLFGQLLLENTYGSEWDALPVAVEAQYYNGQRFIKNTADNCTEVDYHNLSLIDPPAQLSTIIPMGLPGPLAVEKGINIPRSLMLSPPGAAGDVQITYQAPPWLGVAEEPEQNPKAFATFGVYGGHDRIINWQEIYNQ